MVQLLFFGVGVLVHQVLLCGECPEFSVPSCGFARADWSFLFFTFVVVRCCVLFVEVAVVCFWDCFRPSTSAACWFDLSEVFFVCVFFFWIENR